MPWFAKHRMRLLLVGLFLLAFLLFQAGMKGPREQNWFDRTLLTVTAPIQKAVVWVVDGAAQLWQDYVWLVGVEEENKQLREQIGRLQREQAQQAQCLAENRRLLGLVNMADRLREYRFVGARVVGVGTSPAAQVIRIDAGSSHGVKLGHAVVSGAGLAGRVSGVVGGYAEVQLVIDGRSAVDVVTRRTRARGIVRGQGAGDLCALEHLVRTADVEEGDEVVTSGIGGLYPAGLPVGTVAAVTTPPVGVFRKAEVNPTVRFGELEDVLVVVTEPNRGDAQEATP